jgi:hypothetical protein
VLAGILLLLSARRRNGGGGASTEAPAEAVSLSKS